MSWNGYTDTLLNGRAKCHYAAIFGHDEKNWAESGGVINAIESRQQLLVGIRGLVSQGMNMSGTHLKFGGHSLKIKQSDDDVLVCQGKENEESTKTTLKLVIAKTRKIVVVGYTPEETVSATDVSNEVMLLKDYLESQGY